VEKNGVDLNEGREREDSGQLEVVDLAHLLLRELTFGGEERGECLRSENRREREDFREPSSTSTFADTRIFFLALFSG